MSEARSQTDICCVLISKGEYETTGQVNVEANVIYILLFTLVKARSTTFRPSWGML
jgi:hypothetical protein